MGCLQHYNWRTRTWYAAGRSGICQSWLCFTKKKPFLFTVLFYTHQACATHGPVVERARVWCEMIGVSFYRFSSDMSSEVGLDETDDRLLVKMLWEAKVYVLQNIKSFNELSEKLTM